VTRVRWKLVGFLFAVNAINYLDRSNLSMAAPTLTKNLHLNAGLMGLVLSAFSWTYAATQIPGGFLVGRVRARLMYFCSVLWWAVASALTALVNSFAALLGVRMLLGIGESPAMPLSVSLTAQWLPVSERGRASAWFTAGVPFGTAVAPPVVAYLLTRFGWQAAFLASAGLSVVWCVVWVLWYRDPDRNPRMSQAEREYIRAGQVEQEREVPTRWRELLRTRNVWGLVLGYFSLLYVLFMFMTWLPSYLVTDRHMTVLKTGFNAAVPWICGTLACLLGGYLSDLLVRKGFRPLIARKSLVVIGLLVATVVIPAMFVSSLVLAVALLSASVSGIMFANGVAWAACEDASPAGKTASIAGMVNFSGNIGGLLAPLITGWLEYLTGSFAAPLVFGGVLALCGAIVYAVLLRDPRRSAGTPEPVSSAAGTVS
jgi:ACS family D-galactonate transporter-like MFS transporter